MDTHIALSLVLIIGWATPAAAVEPIDPDAALVLVEEQMRWIEKVAGRRFLEQPPIHFTGTQELASIIEANTLATHGDGEQAPDQEAIKRIRAEAIETASGQFGSYSQQSQALYLQRDALERLARGDRMSEELRDAVVRCVLTHELVHALQDQHVNRPALRSGEERLGHRALVEGQANLIEAKLCDPDAHRVLDARQGIDVIASHAEHDELLLAYGYGYHYAAALHRHHGHEAIWWALTKPPPSIEQLELVGGAGMLQGWDDPEIVSAPAHAMVDLERWATVVGPTSPVGLLPGLGGAQLDFDATPQALAGLTFRAGRGGRRLLVAAFLLADPDEAAAWIAARRREAQRTRIRRGGKLRLIESVYTSQRRPWVGRLRGLARAHGLDESLWMVIHYGDGAYREHWVSRDGLIVGVAVKCDEVNHRAANRAIVSILERELPTAPPTELPTGFEDALDAAAPPGPPSDPRPSAEYFAQKASRLAQAGQRDACLEALAAGEAAVGADAGLGELTAVCGGEPGTEVDGEQ